MQVSDIMTPTVFSVSTEASIAEIADVLMERKISAVPVLDDDGSLKGIVSEGDLMRRLAADAGTEKHWWMTALKSPESEAREYIKVHGRTAKDIMTRDVISVEDGMSLAELAHLLERNRIKRAPVVKGGKVVGIVSRSNLLQAIAGERESASEEARLSDREIRTLVQESLRSKDFATHGALNVIVDNGVVELWGWVDSEDERSALVLAASEVPGVKEVKDHFGRISPWVWGT